MSDKVRNVYIDGDRVACLANKIIALLERKGRKHPSRDEAISEYWALRVVALLYEDVLSIKFDNEAETVAYLKTVMGERKPTFRGVP
jgi:hypothetical protein